MALHPASRPIVGRAAELRRIDELLERPGGSLVFRGPSGIGLTTLLGEAARRAPSRGFTVLRTSGSEAEQGFAFAALHQLLRPLGSALPTPLQVVFGLAGGAIPSDGEVVDAVAALLGDGPVLVAADDAQWLDAQTCALLAGIASRGVTVLRATHDDAVADASAVGPLAADEAALLLDALWPELDLFVRDRVLALADGVPRALVELPASVTDAGDPALLARFGADEAAAAYHAALAAPDPTARARLLVEAALLARGLGAVTVSERLVALADPTAMDRSARARLLLLHERPDAVLPIIDGVDADTALSVLARSVETGRAAELLPAAEAVAAPDDARLAAILAAAEPDASAARVLGIVRARVDRSPAEEAWLGRAALTVGDPEAALTLLARAAGALGRVEPRARVLPLLAWAQLTVGEWDDATATATEAASLARRVQQPAWSGVAEAALGLLAGLRGAEDDAEALLASAERAALPERAVAVLALVEQARGLVALTAGRLAEAHAHLAGLPPSSRSVADLAEAAVTDAQCVQARSVLAALPPPASPQSAATHAHAAFVLGEGDALDQPWPFGRARVALLHGMRLRRDRRLAESREPLRAAASAFEGLGATPWAERAQRELAATMEAGTRTNGHALTPQELEVARLAARGLTNREIGTTLSLSHRTVASHLSSTFRKLDVRTRAELASAL